MSVVTTACNYAAKSNRKKSLLGLSTTWDLLGVSCADRTRCKIAFSVHLSLCEMEEASLTEVL